MARKSIKTIQYRRKRESKTNYKKRLRYLLSGNPRAAIRKTSNSIIVHIIEYAPKGDLTRVLVNSRALAKYGWKYHYNNVPAAYLTGFLAGVTAKKQKIKAIVIDYGLQKSVHGSALYAAAKGLKDAGFDIGADDTVFPSDKRCNGSHIADYAKKLKGSQEQYKRQFSGYIKSGVEPEKIADTFKMIKDKIGGKDE